jgi:hypothetical protein
MTWQDGLTTYRHIAMRGGPGPSAETRAAVNNLDVPTQLYIVDALVGAGLVVLVLARRRSVRHDRRRRRARD